MAAPLAPPTSHHVSLLTMPLEIRQGVYGFCIPQHLLFTYSTQMTLGHRAAEGVVFRSRKNRSPAGSWHWDSDDDSEADRADDGDDGEGGYTPSGLDDYVDGAKRYRPRVPQSSRTALPGLLLVCRQITDEVTRMMYGGNTFAVLLHGDGQSELGQYFGPETREKMRKMILHLRPTGVSYHPKFRMDPEIWDPVLANLSVVGLIAEQPEGEDQFEKWRMWLTPISEYLGRALPASARIVVDADGKEGAAHVLESVVPGCCRFQRLRAADRVFERGEFTTSYWGGYDMISCRDIKSDGEYDDYYSDWDARFVPSAEQRAIVELSRVQNVVVSATPGSGKTATAEAIARANPGLASVILTYSKRLQYETARRVDDYDMCDVYTFHGMAGRLFGTVVYRDAKLQALRREGERPTWRGMPYDIVILDELQDCTESLYWLTRTFLLSVTHAAGGRPPRIVALGDERQALYDFRGADARYLTLSPTIFSDLSPYEWTHLPLSKSFRLSHENTRFVEEVFLNGENHMTGSHNGPKPLYIHEDVFNIGALAKKLVPLIQKYGPERTAILAPSIRKNTPVAQFTNFLSGRCDIPVAVSTSGDISLDPDVTNNKVCVSTYHQFKGNERDLVIVYGIDDSYFKYYARDFPADRCSNATYVAITRAVKQLVVMHDHNCRPMPFIRLPQLESVAELVSTKEMQPQRLPGEPPQPGLRLVPEVWAAEMARYVCEELLEEIIHTYVEIRQVSPPLPADQHIRAPDKVLTDRVKMMYEPVSDLNGIAVVAAFRSALRRNILGPGGNKSNTVWVGPTEAVHFCRAACEQDARDSGYHSRLVQMRGHPFDWLNEHLDPAVRRLGEQLHADGASENIEFETPLINDKFRVPGGGDTKGKAQVTKLSGSIDIVVYPRGAADVQQQEQEQEQEQTGKRVRKKKKERQQKKAARERAAHAALWEIKFVAQLSPEHVVQACAYAYLWAAQHRLPALPRMVLFNVRDGEKREITVPAAGGHGSIARAEAFLRDVLRAKYTTADKYSTDEFLAACRRVRDEVAAMWAGGREKHGRRDDAPPLPRPLYQ
ncbi:P-loop containing nucleoside triphosphate hydrolase protein [Durotheca rogersii]|uniref:P-loop containing nucleoside triphosphate hydrolase protein n=1 Tax=Durotheca rogersii TaxID=419775 RepID=UPI00221F0FD7|nr:P-loop containing nucleoside triphosphate hydrolase protein [Durotheca rogersii]KAI5862442.1 P-loop containing nucleoside triphosphate hydrolase protein [Durotheca rogersii]